MTERMSTPERPQPKTNYLRTMATLALIGCGASFASSTYTVNRGALAYSAEVMTSTDTLDNDTSRAVSAMAGRPVWADCNDAQLDTYADLQGYNRGTILGAVRQFQLPVPFVEPPLIAPPVMTLKASICRDITSLTHDGLSPNTDTSHQEVASLFTALHELEHTNGVAEEDRASCYAVQRLPAVLARYSDTNNDALLQQVRDDIQRALPPDYLSVECRPGGAYDLKISHSYIS